MHNMLTAVINICHVLGVMNRHQRDTFSITRRTVGHRYVRMITRHRRNDRVPSPVGAEHHDQRYS